jgi:hypothetical protein
MYGHLKAEVTNCTPEDAYVWCPTHVEAMKLNILSHLDGSLPFTIPSVIYAVPPEDGQGVLETCKDC